MSRPELGELHKGDVVIMRSSYRAHDPGNCREMTVVSLGPRWVGLADHTSKWFGTEQGKSMVRRFLLSDQREGEPGKRIGHSCLFATREQHAYDVRLSEAIAYVRDVAGLDVRRGVVPFAGDEGILKLAHLLSLMESSWRPPSTST
jgi:hypothetical protein